VEILNIAIDFDETYTLAPLLWDKIIKSFMEQGHSVHLVTWRSQDEREEVDIEISNWQVAGKHFTARKAKRKYMEDEGIYIDVWIDDNPAAILYDMPSFKTSEEYNSSLWI
jgi:hypothetical protein